MRFFCPCPRGLESVLAHELRALGAHEIDETGGGVGFGGTITLAYRANLHSRIASRVLLEIARRPYRREADLYALTHEQRWENHFSASQTLRVDTTAIRSPLKSLNFANLRVKDGIVDRMRERTGSRPSIDTDAPDVRVFSFLTGREATLYLDLSGEPLFKRGWRAGRERKGEAPIKENLAAGLLALARWQPGTPLRDLFCGAGTIPIEAAQIAAGRAPGLDRRFAIERLALHRAAQAQRVEDDARETLEAARADLPARLDAAPISGIDIDPDAIAMSIANLDRAGLPPWAVRFEVGDAREAPPPAHAGGTAGLELSNPPYGERVEIDTATWRAVGANLRTHYREWRACFITADRGLPGQLGLRERRKTPLFNGAIECRLFEFELFPPKPAG
ncbi:MAG: class I SAM-dependent RNA methyltransferase [Lautropia sp.]